MQASSPVIPLWLITLASKELSRFEVTSSDFSAESGSMEGRGGGWWYHFCQMVGKKMRIIKVLVLKDSLFYPEINCCLQSDGTWTSLVVQWLRLCLLEQGV